MNNRDDGQARARIVDAAVSLFAAHGFDGTSTARIARTADVPKGLLFYYFPAKADVLSAVLAERLGTANIDPIPLAVPGNPARALMNVGDRILRNHEASDVLREILWHESHTRPDVHAALTRYRRTLHATIESVLVASLPHGAESSALHAAADAWGAIVTARPLEGLESGALHEARTLRSIAALLCAGLTASPTSTASV
ncbi:TetR/AcrR family transcriptional regulator [Paramicrobacterium fandaimingii]|uniref:TetR/AcrR family transcriptional regulator n=1 Tax=Paramicrobacterium fandaimingii TaxID=2708079 RepID=UPI00142452EA|nr:TetR/AcrR family transcriptional regulator [Microbacterium fandaimingii]